jgi:signal transduction histidine kinase
LNGNLPLDAGWGVPLVESVGTGADIAAMGHRALGRLGARVAWLYLGTAALALAAGALSGVSLGGHVVRPEQAAGGGPGALDRIGWLVAAVAVGVCGIVLQRATAPGAEMRIKAAAVAAAAVASGTLALLAEAAAWTTAGYLSSVAATAGGAGLALGAGARWGIAACAASLTVVAVVLSLSGGGLGPVYVVGTSVSTAVCVVIVTLFTRGFDITEKAIAGADAAAVARQVSALRWRARRRTDRHLHDTVLTTLSLLTHEEFGTPADELRRLCRRDMRVLEAAPPAVPEQSSPRPAERQGANAARRGDALDHLATRWRRSGLSVSVHGRRWSDVIDVTGQDAQRAMLAAVGECLSNVRAHSGVAEANIVVSRDPGAISVMVVDSGRGFDPAVVRPDRLGLVESVSGRLQDIGGEAKVWSRPGEGTTVLMTVPVAPHRAGGDARVPLAPEGAP